MEKIIETFLEGYDSENTRRRYKAVLLDFSDFVGDILTVKSADIFEYHDEIKRRQGIKPRHEGTQKYSGRTIRNTIEIVKSFYVYLEKRGKIKVNPFSRCDIKLPREHENEKRPTEILQFDKVMEICNAPSRYTKKGIRDRAILALLFGGALRKSEIINLKISDIHAEEDGIILVLRNTKAKKTERQSIAPWATEKVIRLIEVRKSEYADSQENLIVNYRTKKEIAAKKIPISTFDRIFKKWRDFVGGSRAVSPHSARATAISRLLHKQVPIRDVQLFARHASVETTEKYDKRYYITGKTEAKKLEYG